MRNTNDDPTGVVSVEKTIFSSSNTVNENPSLGSMEMDAGTNEHVGKAVDLEAPKTSAIV